MLMKSAFPQALLAVLFYFVAGPVGDADAAAGDRRSISRTDVNVRTGPSLDERILMVINPGETIVEISTEGDWVFAEFPDKKRKGWLYGPLLDTNVAANAEVPSAEPLATRTAAPGQTSTSNVELAPERAGQETPAIAYDGTWSDGDPVNGRKVFYKCGACHTVAPGVNAIGPSLAGVVGSRPAGASGFGYSSGMRKFAADGAVWDEATLDEFIRRPARLVRGTSMPFSGIRDADDRRDLIAFLSRLDD